MGSIKSSLLGFGAEHFGLFIGPAIDALKTQGDPRSAWRIASIVLEHTEYVSQGVEALKAMDANVAADSIAMISGSFETYVPTAIAAYKEMAVMKRGRDGEGDGRAEEGMSEESNFAVNQIRYLVLAPSDYIPEAIDALKEINTREAALAIASIAMNCKEAVPQAIDALKDMGTDFRVWAIAQIMMDENQSIPTCVPVLKEMMDKANRCDFKGAISRVVDDVTHGVLEKCGDNAAIRPKLDLVEAFRKTSFPDSERHCNKLLRSVAQDRAGLSEFCIIECGGRMVDELNVAILRAAFRGASPNLQGAVEGIILHTSQFEAARPA